MLIETSDYTTAQWQQMYDEAGTVAELARRMKRNVATIRYHLKRAGVIVDPKPVLPPRANEHFADFDHAQWQKMYDDAATVRELARSLNQPISTVRYNLIRAGVKPRRSGYKVHNRKSAGKGPNHHNWKGGTHIKDGYIWEYAPDHPLATKKYPYIQQHRLVMEQKLGRYLESWEDVHHKDENRTNNDPDNLELKSRPDHMGHHAEQRLRDARGRFSK